MSDGPVRWGNGSPLPEPSKGEKATGELGGRRVVAHGGAGKAGDVAGERLRGISPGITPVRSPSPEAITVRSSSPAPLKGVKIEVKDDGNCLFHSLQWGLEEHQDYLHRYGLQSGRIDDKQIRKELSDSLSSMLSEDPDGFGIQFLGILFNANEQTESKIGEAEATRDLLKSEGLPASEIRELDRQIADLRSQIIDDPAVYASLVKTDGFWGGEAEIIAFANRYCMNVKVLEQKGGSVEDTRLPVITPKEELLSALGIKAADVPTIYLIASKKHYDYFRPA